MTMRSTPWLGWPPVLFLIIWLLGRNHMKTPPARIRISHDKYHAKYVGRTATGDQFFVTTPFVPAVKRPGREFVAVFLFYSDGRFKDAIIDDLGPRSSLDASAAKQLFERRVSELGRVAFCDVEVAPFQIVRHDVEFGLIPRPPEDDRGSWWVILEPGNYMAFAEPFDGDYDT